MEQGAATPTPDRTVATTGSLASPWAGKNSNHPNHPYVDPQQVKSITWLLALACGGLAVITAGVGLAAQRNIGRATLVGGIALSGVAALVALMLPHGNGAPGIAGALALAVLLAPLASQLTTPEPESARPNLLPAVFLLAASLCFMGVITHHYGVRATMQWYGYSAGLALGLAWAAAAPRGIRELSGPALCALAVVWVTLMACFHYPWPATAPWFAFFCGVGILGGWTLSLVATSLMSGSSNAPPVCAFILAIAASLVSWSAQRSLVANEHLLAAVSVGFLAALLLLLATSVVVGEPNELDPLAGVFVVLVVGGVAWVGFKLWLGLGIVVSALGFLAAYPALAASGTYLASRAATLAGGFLLLLSGMKIFQEAAELSLNGIDISEGNVTIALIAGAVFPILLESIVARPSAVRFLGGLVAVAVGVLCGPLYFGVDGTATALLGIALWSLLAAVSFTASGSESGLLTFRALPYAIVLIALCLLLLPLRDYLVEVSRAQKQQILTLLGILAALGITGIGTLRKKQSTHRPSGADS